MKKKSRITLSIPPFSRPERSPLSSNTRKNTIDLISKQNFINVNLAVYLDIPTGRFHPTKQSISNTKCFSSWPLSTFLIGPLNLLSLSAIIMSDNKFASTMTTRTGRGNGRMQGRKEGRKEGSMRRAREYANDCSYGISAARAHVTFVGVVDPRWGSGRSYWPRPAPTLHTLCRRLEKSSTAPNMAIDAPRSVLGRANDAFLASCCPPGCR